MLSSRSKRGVDVLVVAGTEAGGHCGEVSTMVLVPEVAEAVKDSGAAILAAGGIVTGRPNGGSDGDGCGWRVDRFGVAYNNRSRDFTGYQREVRSSKLASNRSFEVSYR